MNLLSYNQILWTTLSVESYVVFLFPALWDKIDIKLYKFKEYDVLIW